MEGIRARGLSNVVLPGRLGSDLRGNLGREGKPTSIPLTARPNLLQARVLRYATLDAPCTTEKLSRLEETLRDKFLVPCWAGSWQLSRLIKHMETYKDESHAWEMRFFLCFQLPGLSGLLRHTE